MAAAVALLVGSLVFAISGAILAACWLAYRRHAAFWPASTCEPCCPRAPRALLAFRVAVAAMCSWALHKACESSVFTVEDFLHKIAIFFTLWNWVLITVCFAVGAVRQLAALNGRAWLSKTHLVLCEVCIPTAPFVSVVTWTVLYPTSGFSSQWLSMSSIFMHVINSVVCLVEYYLSNPRFERIHVVFLYVWSACYLVCVTVLQLWAGAPAPYFFLNVQKAFTVGAVVGVVFVGGLSHVPWVWMSDWRHTGQVEALSSVGSGVAAVSDILCLREPPPRSKSLEVMLP